MTAQAAPFAWYGGKARLAGRIVDLLPAHHTYVEAFGGAAAVLFSKPRARLEVYNDVDSGLVTFFRVLRDQAEALARALRLTPYAREEFTLCRDSWESVEDDVERARRWYVRMRQSFGCSATVGWGFEATGAARAGTRSSSFASTVAELERFAERFRVVQIDHLDWRECLARYDRAGACFYLDPPYHPETRGVDRHNAYRHDLEHGDHVELVERVAAATASVILSGFSHPVYDQALAEAGFERFEIKHQVTASRVLSGRRAVTEVLWRRLERGAQPALTLQGGASHDL